MIEEIELVCASPTLAWHPDVGRVVERVALFELVAGAIGGLTKGAMPISKRRSTIC